MNEDLGWIGRVHRRTDVALGYGLHPGGRRRAGDGPRGPLAHTGGVEGIPAQRRNTRSGDIRAARRRARGRDLLLLRTFAVPAATRILTTLALMWLYILVAGAPPSAIRAGVVATLVLGAGMLGRQLAPLHFMTTMLAAVLSYNPLLVYNAGFQLSVSAVFGILLLGKPLKALLERTLLRPFAKPPQALSNLLSVSLAAQSATTPIVASSFGEVSVIGVLTNLLAVPLSGPILTLGLVGSVLERRPCARIPSERLEWLPGNPARVDRPCSFLLPVRHRNDTGVTLLLVSLFYAGCVPAALCGSALPERQAPLWATVLVMWVVLWLVLVSAGGL